MSTRFLHATGVNGEAFLVMPGDSHRPQDYEIHAIYTKYTAIGPPSLARQVRVTMEDPEGHLFAISGGDTQPVNTVRNYMAYPDAPLLRVPNGDDIQWLPWPSICIVVPGTTIRVRNASGVATPSDLVELRLQYDISFGNRGSGAGSSSILG